MGRRAEFIGVVREISFDWMKTVEYQLKQSSEQIDTIQLAMESSRSHKRVIQDKLNEFNKTYREQTRIFLGLRMYLSDVLEYIQKLKWYQNVTIRHLVDSRLELSRVKNLDAAITNQILVQDDYIETHNDMIEYRKQRKLKKQREVAQKVKTSQDIVDEMREAKEQEAKQLKALEQQLDVVTGSDTNV